MPLSEGEELYGCEADGRINKDYCKYCYDKGAFTCDCTMEEMIDICVPHMIGSDMPEDQARAMMLATFPTLKRWKK